MPSAPRPAATVGDRLLRLGLWAAVAAVALQTLAHWTNAFLLDDAVWNLDADVEGNAFTWASSAFTFAAAIGAFLWALASGVRRERFLVLAGILALFSLDDVVQMHEQLGLEVGEDILGMPDYLAVRLWTVFYLPLLLVAGYLLWELPRLLWEPAARFVRGGLLLLVAAFVVELLGAPIRWLEDRGTRWPNDLRTGVEEGLELGAWVLIAAGLLAAVCVRLASEPGIAREST